MLKKMTIIFLSIVITLSFLLPYSALKKERLEKEVQRNKYITSQKINDISQKLVEVLNQSFEYVEVLELIVNMNPNNPELIKTYAEMIIQKHDIIANIAIAPDGIIKYIYPIEPNLEVIGHNLMIDPQRYPFIKKAIEEKRATIQGPVNAIQGGLLIFNRKALFLKEDDIDSFWGLCVVSVDFNKVMDYCGISTDDPEYYYAIKALRSDGFQDLVWGNSECFEKDSITYPISFENQKWELAIYPKQGWIDNGSNLESTDKLYLLMSFILFMSVLWHLNQYSKNSKRAKIDIMTGALNKYTFRKRIIKNIRSKQNKMQAIIVIDINDFKSINDTYGHLTGDSVIIELSKRLMKLLNNNDLLSRWGGDEFVVYLHSLNTKADIKNMIELIHNEVEGAVDVGAISIDVRVALGYAFYPNDGVRFDELYKKADMMMYSNKSAK